jgi:hypothetical protein
MLKNSINILTKTRTYKTGLEKNWQVKYRVFQAIKVFKTGLLSAIIHVWGSRAA